MRHSEHATLGLITGAAIGGTLMYLADPDRGNRRRALAREKAIHGIRQLGTLADKGVRDLRNRARGVVFETWSVLRRARVSEEVLIDRVRAKIGRNLSHPGAIEVAASNGQIVLSGPVLENELDDLIDAVYSVHGVHRVENRLEPHEAGENVPRLQGAARRRQSRPELLQEAWAPGTRLLMGAGGALALAFPSRNRSIELSSRILGGLVLARAVTNFPLRRLFGLIRSRRTIRFQKTITIHEPIERVFEFWSNPESFARIMNHVHEVKKTGENRFRWTVSGPAGTSGTWDSHIVESVPNRMLAWRSDPGSLIRNAGIIRFESTGDGGTRVHLLMSYNPPAGAIGHAIAKLFGVGPKDVLDEDLVRMKSLFEHGKTRAHGETVTREQLSA